MLACVDVDYRGDGTAVAACLAFQAWTSAIADHARVARTDSGVPPYRPGAFFERELPNLLRVLEHSPCPIETVVIDGYVTLDPHGRAGLGAHLFEALSPRSTVVGVAKTPFRAATHAIPVTRGRSRAPLWITARGMDPRAAAAHVASMVGTHRVPTLLREVDRVARSA